MNKSEPLISRALIASVLQIIALVGVSISPDLQNALTVLILAAVPVATMIAAALARRKVSPTDQV